MTLSSSDNQKKNLEDIKKINARRIITPSVSFFYFMNLDPG